MQQELCENGQFSPATMSILRSTFIALSHNKLLRRFSERSVLGRRLSGRFVAGMTVERVVHAASSRNPISSFFTSSSPGTVVRT